MGVSAGIRDVRIVVVEDHPLFRRGLVDFLDSVGMRVVGTASTVRGAVEAVVSQRPDIVLMDFQLEDGSGIDAIGRVLAAVGDHVKVVMLSESGDPADMLAAVHAGAVGYLTKDQRPDRLAEAIAGVIRGEAALSRTMAAHLVEDVRRADRRPAARSGNGRPKEPLTPRQLEILRLIAVGQTTGEIAGELYLSPETIRWHVKAILRKLNARTRAEAAAALREMAS
jgi:two-component system, NarL family, nitrate/nitrite response regulator NarL